MPLLEPVAPPARVRHWAPTTALTAAALLIAVSLFLPYWSLRVQGPERAALELHAYLGSVHGPVGAVLAAAGRSGEAPLRDLSELERSLVVATATVVCFLLLAATLVRNRWAALVSLPALVFPFIVMADTARWLRPVLHGLCAGAGGIAVPTRFPFQTLACGGTVLETRAGSGLILATLAAVVVVVGLALHRRAYRRRPAEPEIV